MTFLLIVFFSMVSGIAQEPADVAGAWSITVETQNEPITVSAKLTVDGTKLTGTLFGPQGDFPLAGSVEGEKIEFTLRVPIQGNELVITFSGTASRDSMKGTTDFGGRGSGSWSAARPKG